MTAHVTIGKRRVGLSSERGRVNIVSLACLHDAARQPKLSKLSLATEAWKKPEISSIY
jgi:hypothetical protein